MPMIDLDLARRLEAADAAWVRRTTEATARLRPDLEAWAVPFGGGQAAYNGRHSHLTCVRGFGLDGPISKRDLRGLEWRYRLRHSAFRVDVCPLTDRSLALLLGRRGYRLFGFHEVAVRRLKPPPRLDSVAPSLDVEEARPEDEAVWIDVLARGFASSDTPPEDYRRVAAAHWHTEGCVQFLGRRDGEVAAAASLFVHEGVALLAISATLASMRGTGAQTELIGARMRRAVEMGCDLACAMTIPDSSSLRNLRRWGFNLAYTRPVLEKRWWV